jgi:hypothetical protein
MTRFEFPFRHLAVAALVALGLGVMHDASAQTTTRQTPPPAPKPFPQPGSPATSGTVSAPPSTAPAAVPPAAPVAPGAPTEASLGVPIYPTAQFLGSYEAGQGQRLFLYGSNSAYLDVVGYYRTVMKTGGREIFKAPATQEFDLPGVKYVEDTMPFVPGVTVKDYTWGGSEGYLFVDGTKQTRFKTIIQIVPAAIR